MGQVVPPSRWTRAVVVAAACGQIITSSAPVAQGITDRVADAAPASRPHQAASGKTVQSGDWPNIHIADVYTRDAAKRALQGASRWLTRPKCQTLFVEFKDERNLPLATKLGQLKTDPERYLRMVLFLDGSQSLTCKRHGIVAFTARGSRVVYLCGREFERAWRRDARELQATIIHELLHSLGLGENPPTPRYITQRVQRLCWD